MKKRVLVDMFYLNTAITGIKTYMTEFYEAVSEQQDAEVEYVFTHHINEISKNMTFRGDISKINKLIYHVYYFIWKQILLPLKVWKYKPDVLLCFDFVAPAIPLSTKKLVVIHDAFFWQMPQNYKSGWRKYFLSMIKLGLQGDTTVVTTSEYSKRSLLEVAKLPNPIQVIYQCPKLLSSATSELVLPSLHLLPKNYFLHVGSFDKRKLLPVLVKAFALFKKSMANGTKLVLVGERGLSESVDDYDEVMSVIRQYALEDEVILPGFLSDQEVKTLYEYALVYVFPSSNEGFGIPVIEAMNNQVPVIISDQEALMEIAGGAALVTKTGDAEDLSNAMITLANSMEARVDLVAKGNLRKELFSRDAFYKAFKAIF